MSVAGMLGEQPPTELEAFRAFAAGFAFPDIADAIRDAQPLDGPATARFRANQRTRYERLRRFPAGLLVIGDAVCSFNPTYGQGMTVAALQVAALRDLLASGEGLEPGRYFRRIAQVLDLPWDMAVGADLANPRVAAKRSLKNRVLNAYLPRLHAAAATDPSLAVAFINVTGMLAAPQGLLRPDRVLRVLTATGRGRTG